MIVVSRGMWLQAMDINKLVFARGRGRNGPEFDGEGKDDATHFLPGIDLDRARTQPLPRGKEWGIALLASFEELPPLSAPYAYVHDTLERTDVYPIPRTNNPSSVLACTVR